VGEERRMKIHDLTFRNILFELSHHTSLLDDGIARIASGCFDMAIDLSKYVEVVRYNTSVCSSSIILLNIGVFLGRRDRHIDGKCISSHQRW
jgi:hypothetical protein